MDKVLVKHFFRRFFDSDTVSVEGETLTTVVRALAAVAVPGLMVAFFLQSQYPGRRGWGVLVDAYFFVLVSFVVMGAVAIFEWEMLFPDRLDFLVLTPLPVQPRRMLTSKVAALVGFLALFLVAANVFGPLIFSMLRPGNFYRNLLAQLVAGGLAGVFAALFFLALSGTMLCVLGGRWFRLLSPVVQMLGVAALVLLALHYVRFGDGMEGMLTGSLHHVRWLPTLWFLGVYEVVLHGTAAPAFAVPMARIAVLATLLAGQVVLVTYPLAWRRMQRLAFEGMASERGGEWRAWRAVVRRLMPRAGERAMFQFIGRTVARNNRYQVYLAIYGGVGLALAVCCAVTFTGLRPGLSTRGLHAQMPLLLFWVVAGLRSAFAFPLDLKAGWLFRVTGVNVNECAAAARRWVLLCALAVMCAILGVLAAVGWDAHMLLVQAVVGTALSVLLVDGFFLGRATVPLNTARMPGRTSLPLVLTLYVGAFPPFCFAVIALEGHLEGHLWKLLMLVSSTVCFHGAARLLQERPAEVEEEMEGYEGEFQLLGLS